MHHFAPFDAAPLIDCPVERHKFMWLSLQTTAHSTTGFASHRFHDHLTVIWPQFGLTKGGTSDRQTILPRLGRNLDR
jgi:hypothetical protein